MNRLFSIHETAEIEINEAADFYDLEGQGDVRSESAKNKM
jgi:hypothetical protein